jgi:hypothetical protein
MDTQESMSEYPALEIGANLSLHEPRDRGALPSRLSQEGLELLANDFYIEPTGSRVQRNRADTSLHADR